MDVSVKKPYKEVKRFVCCVWVTYVYYSPHWQRQVAFLIIVSNKRKFGAYL